MGAVATLGLSEIVYRNLLGSNGAEVNTYVSWDLQDKPDILKEIKESASSFDLVLLGTDVHDPVQMSQRIHAIDKALSIMVLVDEVAEARWKRAFQFAPYIGDCVQCVKQCDLAALAAAISDFCQKTKVRRNHSRMINRINSSMAKESRSAEALPAERYFDRLLDLAPIGICLIDKAGYILGWNYKAHALTQLSERKALTKKIYTFFQAEPECLLKESIEDVFSTQTAVTLDCKGTNENSQRFFELTLGALGDGSASSLMVIIQDITSRREAQLQVLNAKREAEEANEAKSSFLANMSHEIRTPISAMLGFLDFLKQPDLTAEDKLYFIGTIDRNGAQLLRLIDDILDISKIEAGKLTTDITMVPLIELIADIKSMMTFRAAEKGLEFKVRFETDMPTHVYTDPGRIRQILLNFIGNAIKFTLSGTIELVVGLIGNELEFHVVDTGVGVSPSQASRLFQPFSQADATVTRKFGGTGLGLALSKRIAQALGGDAVLKSSVLGVGSTFYCHVPVQRVPGAELRELDSLVPFNPAMAVQELAAVPKPLYGMRILVVEDSPDIQMLVTRILSIAGAVVDLESNGEAGATKALSAFYNAVLMDVQMPVLDGLESTKKLRSKGYDRPIVALTAHALPEERRKSFAAGCTDHLTKPIDKTELVRVLLRYKDA